MVKSVQIAVAAHELPIGTKIAPSDIKLVRWSREDVPPGAYTDAAALMNQYTKTNIVQSEPIVADRLFSGDKNAGVLPLLIPTGMRAVAVPVDEVSDIAGFVRPHARVDVLISVSAGGTSEKPFSKIVLQNVEVLAAAQEIENVQDKPEVVKVVTLLVTPDEAERLSLASREGTLRLALRNYVDKKIVTTTGVDVPQMLRAYGGPQAPVVVTPQGIVALPIAHGPRVKPIEVEIMRNGKSSENVSFIRADGRMQQSPAGESGATRSAPDSADKMADSAPDHAGMGATGAMNPPATDASSGPATTSSARPLKPGAANHRLAAVDSPRPWLGGAGSDDFNGPTPKTIDVP
jgi:pilus assembly protein CpaB